MGKYTNEALILAFGMICMGKCISNGAKNIGMDDRTVNVKGLAEMEVPANKVIWPLMYKNLGNDLQALYSDIKQSNLTIINFLKEKGITEEEISVNAPEIIDLKAERYSSSDQSPYRYNVTSVITVTSNKVDLIRSLISEQGELLKQGIAITSGDYRYNVQYEFTGLNDIKPKMIKEATQNARKAAEQFASDSHSKLDKIKNANQGQFSIRDRDANTPYIKNVRVVTSITYSLDD